MAYAADGSTRLSATRRVGDCEVRWALKRTMTALIRDLTAAQMDAQLREQLSWYLSIDTISVPGSLLEWVVQGTAVRSTNA
jgi:hypothetical protein